jgi:hypothetical protein
LADLDGYDRKLFQKDYGSRCPGLVKVDLYGDGEPTWALVLVGSGKPTQRKAELVVARQTSGVFDAGWGVTRHPQTGAAQQPRLLYGNHQEIRDLQIFRRFPASEVPICELVDFEGFRYAAL